MAEALAVVGAVASIVQLVEFGTKVLRRLDEFHSKLDDVPKSFQRFRSQLPLLLDTLKRTEHDIDTGIINSETEDALLPAISGCKIEIQSLDSILDQVLPIATDSLARKSKKAILSLYKDSDVEKIASNLESYVQTLTFYHAATRSSLSSLKDEKLTKIRQWLAAPDPSPNFQRALKLRQTDTGLWFLCSDQYVNWKADPSSFIWLHGIPGCGKTVLSTTIIENILQHFQNEPGKIIAYYYFDFNDHRKQRSELMIRSLITQISQQCTEIPRPLDSLFGSCEDGQRQPSVEALLDILRQVCDESPSIFIVLDALDECTDREELMAIINALAEWRLERLHILVTSRKERDIEASLESIVDKSNILSLRDSIVDQDIQRYVRHRLSVDKSLKKWQKDPEICNEIEVALMNGARGMFRWAVCQLDTLAKCLNRAALRKAIKGLPATLDKTYERILCNIQEDYSIYALRILQWLAFSARPLSIEEVAEVVGIDPQRRPVVHKDEFLEDPMDVLTICSSLVAISVADGVEADIYIPERPVEVINLAHYSVKEYLISERIRQGPAQRYSLRENSCSTYLASCCVGYLLQFQNTESFCLETITNHKLARYSAKFWTIHARLCTSEEDTTQKLIMELLSLENGAYLNWIRIHDLDEPWDTTEMRERTDVAPPLYYASLASLPETVRRLVHIAGNDVNAQGGHYGNALQAASLEGHKPIIDILLNKGADINAQSGLYGCALQAASFEGHESIVQLLLDKGANVNTEGGEYGNALQAASYSGQESIVQLLLDTGANVNTEGGEYGNALHAASYGGHESIVQLLLDKGADVNSQGGRFGSALQAALHGGHESIVQLLLDKGADVNSQFDGFGNALQAASCEGHESIVQLLLSEGADINAQGGYFGSALQAASYIGAIAIVQLLLDNGADINAQGGRYGNALQAASAYGHESIVQLLLSKGADVNAQGGERGNALQAASSEGYIAIVQLLLDSGAEINTQGGHYSNALQAASYRGRKSIVQLLLSKGADVNAQGGKYGNALQAASSEGYIAIVQLLLDNGAEINAQGGYYGNALQAALSNSRNLVAELLLNHGAIATSSNK